jgi:hypothetical protein
MTERQAIKQAKKRGLVTKEQARAVALPRHRRHCPACGETFLPVGSGHKGFGCACCAYEWGEARIAGTLDRSIRRGVEVILVADGQLGVVERVASADAAVVQMEDGRRLTVAPRDVERCQRMAITHRADCPRNAGKDLAARLAKRAAAKANGEETD